MTTEQLTQRTYTEEMNVRSAAVAESSIDKEARTVRAVLTTDQPVPVYDWRSRAVIEEVLTTDGGTFARQLPMFDDHWMSSSRQLGSVRNIAKGDSNHEGTLHFARDAGDFRDEAWQMVLQRHVTDVSIGYTYGPDDYVDIAPGQRATVKGKEYVASKSRAKRVVTNWRAKEVSTTPIGADDLAKIRSQKKHVVSGTPSESRSNSSSGPLANTDSIQEKSLMDEDNVTTETETDSSRSETTANPPRNENSTEPGESQRSESTTTATTATTATATAPPAPVAGSDEAEIRRTERERITEIESYRGEIEDEQLQRALDDNWNVDRVRSTFDHMIVTRLRQGERNESPVVGPNHRLARGGNLPTELRALQAGLLMRCGIEPDHIALRSGIAEQVVREANCDGGWLTRAARSLENNGGLGEAERAIDHAYQLRSLPVRDIIRRCLELDGIRTSSIYDDSELLQRASSSASVAVVFTLAFNARMLVGFTSIPDTTSSWTREDSLPSYQPAQRIQMGKFTKLRLRERGSEPEHGTISADAETLQVFQYAEMFIVDEQDVIDDTMGGTRMSPEEMGEAAAELRPDLVYATLLANPTMADGVALFHTASHGNLNTGSALADGTLTAAATQMATQKLADSDRHINVSADILIVPRSKRDDARKLILSREQLSGGTINPHFQDYTLVAEPRLDTGVVSPLTQTKIDGEPGSWFLASRNGRYGITVAGLQGRGNRPRSRRLQNVNHGFGMGWSVDHVIGVGPTGHEGIQKNEA